MNTLRSSKPFRQGYLEEASNFGRLVLLLSAETERVAPLPNVSYKIIVNENVAKNRRRSPTVRGKNTFIDRIIHGHRYSKFKRGQRVSKYGPLIHPYFCLGTQRFFLRKGHPYILVALEGIFFFYIQLT